MKWSRSTDPVLPEAPQLPAAVPPRVREFAPPPRRYSEEALRAAQHLEDLTTECEQLRREAAHLKNLLDLCDEKQQSLQTTIEQLTEQRDHYHQRCVTIETKMGVVSSILFEVLDSATKQPTEPVDVKTEETLQSGLAELVKS